MADLWTTVEARVDATANQSPDAPTALFAEWVQRGWTVTHVTVLPPPSPMFMCTAIGVLKKRDPDVIG